MPVARGGDRHTDRVSYDITLVQRRPGQDWEDAVDEAVERGDADAELDDERRRQWAQIEREVRELVGDVDSDVDAAVAELAHPESGLQVSLFAHEAAVSYPYWDQPDRQGFHRLVADVVAIVEKVTGLSAYDPQTGEAFNGTPDDERGLEAARSLSEGGGRDRDASSEDTARARRYLGIGAVVTLAAAVYLLTGRTSPLMVIALAIGVVDLAVGAYFLTRARRAIIP